MTIWVEVIITAVALAMDAVAVSIAAGLARGKARVRDALRLAGLFGAFQGGMPLLGALLGSQVRAVVARAAPAVAGAVLVVLGVVAVRASLAEGDDDATLDFFRLRVALGLALATSVDAFAVGVSFSLVDVPIVASAAVIAGVTAVLCLPAVLLAERAERLFGPRTELIGGVALVAIGLRFLAEAAAIFG